MLSRNSIKFTELCQYFAENRAKTVITLIDKKQSVVTPTVIHIYLQNLGSVVIKV